MLHICTGVTLAFCTGVTLNCTTLSQSESSNFFMCIIIEAIRCNYRNNSPVNVLDPLQSLLYKNIFSKSLSRLKIVLHFFCENIFLKNEPDLAKAKQQKTAQTACSMLLTFLHARRHVIHMYVPHQNLSPVVTEGLAPNYFNSI